MHNHLYYDLPYHTFIIKYCLSLAGKQLHKILLKASCYIHLTSFKIAYFNPMNVKSLRILIKLTEHIT